MASGRAYVIGGGMAGLAAATALAKRGVAVELFEAGPQAGGRCRSYFDPTIGSVIDNGNHLVLSGNRAVMGYLARIGATKGQMPVLAGPDHAVVDFVDLRDDKSWRLQLSDGIVPAWIFSDSKRVPGTHVKDYAAYAPLLWANKSQTIGQAVKERGVLWRRLMHPFLLSALNTEPEEGSAALAGSVLRQSLVRGGHASRPRIAHPTLAAAFVDPALAYLESKGAKVNLSTRLRGFTIAGRAARALEFSDAVIPTGMKDAVILAVNAPVAQDLLPGLKAPNDFRAIVNAHFKIVPPSGASPMLGVIGGTAEWIFTFHDRISVTISGADAIVDEERESLAVRIWEDVRKALNLDVPLPPWQIVKEKRATFAATPAQDALRPGPRGPIRNVILAGDWTQTGLPATIEGAIRSGDTAARLALRHLNL
ncbi:MAG TPA: hydroxysqualene dehydroxylase HpnE [Rhizomicrobium sp.]|nr:hydroxysqualene dehydroxylase HpnE [Rhizomicrobium sp.]